MSRSARDQRGGHRDSTGRSSRRSRVKWLARHMNRQARRGRRVHRHAARWEMG